MKRVNKKLPLNKLLKKVEPQKADICQRIIIDYGDHIRTIPGSLGKHHAWVGGYISHVEESMNLAVILYDDLNSRRRLPFSLSDALFALFLHDFDKIIRYERKQNGEVSSKTYEGDYVDQIDQILSSKYGYRLASEERNAIKYAHGEGSDYHPTDRVMLPLATLVHCCDIISARIWFDEGREHSSW